MADADRDGSMTLAVDLEAAKALSDPYAAFSDAQEWTEHLGIVADPQHLATAYSRRHRLPHEFFLDAEDRRDCLWRVRQQFATDRYVYIGTEADHRHVAAEVDWEYLTVEEAADKADWELASESPSTLLGRLRETLRNLGG